jgi:hypothetical protein
VYNPIALIAREAGLLTKFPGSTEADLYVFVGKHWSELNKRYGPLFTLEEAAEDFSESSRWPRGRKAAQSLAMRLRAVFRLPRR